MGAKPVHVHETTLPPTLGVAIRATIPVDRLTEFFGPAFQEIIRAVNSGGAHVVGPPFARYFTTPPGPVDVEAVFPVDKPVPPRGRAKTVTIEGGMAIQAMHIGTYDKLGEVYEELEHFMKDHKLDSSGPPREIYLTGPDADPADMQTVVVWPTREATA